MNEISKRDSFSKNKILRDEFINNDKKCLTVKEIYDLGIIPLGKNKLYELVKSKDFPALRVGRKYIVPVAALYNWLETSVAKSYIQVN
jgi:excisionase family DNA binding protein